MRRLVLLDSAVDDFVSILEYITRESGSIQIGQDFVDRLQRQCAKLAKLPGTLGTARPDLQPNLRSFAFKNYIIFFRYTDRSFEVVNVLEGHRDSTGFFKRSQ